MRDRIRQGGKGGGGEGNRKEGGEVFFKSGCLHKESFKRFLIYTVKYP